MTTCVQLLSSKIVVHFLPLQNSENRGSSCIHPDRAPPCASEISSCCSSFSSKKNDLFSQWPGGLPLLDEPAGAGADAEWLHGTGSGPRGVSARRGFRGARVH